MRLMGETGIEKSYITRFKYKSDCYGAQQITGMFGYFSICFVSVLEISLFINNMMLVEPLVEHVKPLISVFFSHINDAPAAPTLTLLGKYIISSVVQIRLEENSAAHIADFA